LVRDLVDVSEAAGDIRQSDEIGEAMLALRSFMFERVYLGGHARGEHARAYRIIRGIFDHLDARGDEPDAIVEFIAGMTDRFALHYAETLD
jgi:dGTPase